MDQDRQQDQAYDPAGLVGELQAIRAQTTRLLEHLTDADLDRTFSGGKVMLRGILRALLEHEQEHLQQLLSARRAARARRTEIEALQADLDAVHGSLVASVRRIPPAATEVARDGSWSVRRILEHLIEMERGWQNEIARLLPRSDDKAVT